MPQLLSKRDIALRGMVELTEHSDFSLYFRHEKDSYYSYYLRKNTGGKAVKKRAWWITSNGERLVKNPDYIILKEHYSEQSDWVERAIMSHIFGLRTPKKQGAQGAQNA